MYAGHTGPCEPENLYEFLKMSQKGSFLNSVGLERASDVKPANSWLK